MQPLHDDLTVLVIAGWLSIPDGGGGVYVYIYRH
jgi:hypothetical protein